MKEDNYPNIADDDEIESTRHHTEELIKELELAQQPEPSSIDAYIATERRQSEIEIRQFHLATLQRFRDEVSAQMDMRRKWVIQSEAQLEALDEAIERISKGVGHESAIERG